MRNGVRPHKIGSFTRQNPIPPAQRIVMLGIGIHGLVTKDVLAKTAIISMRNSNRGDVRPLDAGCWKFKRSL